MRELAVALVGAAGEQHVQRCRARQAGRVGRCVVDLAIGERDHRTEPGAVALGHGLAQA